MDYFIFGKYKTKLSYSIFKPSLLRSTLEVIGQSPVLPLNLTCSNPEHGIALVSLLDPLIHCCKWKCVNS